MVRPHGLANLTICCQKCGTTGFQTLSTSSISEIDYVSFDMCQGDVICYCGVVNPIALSGTAEGLTCLCLDNVVGVGGISASINSTTLKQYDCAAACDSGGAPV